MTRVAGAAGIAIAAGCSVGERLFLDDNDQWSGDSESGEAPDWSPVEGSEDGSGDGFENGSEGDSDEAHADGVADDDGETGTDPGAPTDVPGIDDCAGYPFGATADQIDATPRADPDAELLALLTADTMTAPDELYARIAEDLQTIRAQVPELADFHATPPWGTGFSVVFDAAGRDAVAAGTYHDWDCPNARYGATAMPNPVLPDTAWLELGPALLNQTQLVVEYGALAHVIAVEPGPQLDGPRACLIADGPVHRYLFIVVDESCAGCGPLEAIEVQIDGPGGAVADSGPLQVEDGASLPSAWLRACAPA